MMKQLVVLLLALAAVQTQATVISNIYFDIFTGGATAGHVKLQAGGSYTLQTTLGFQALVQANADVEVWFAGSLQFSGLPTGWSQVDLGNSQIGAGFGFGIYANVTGALSNVVFQSPPLPLFGQQITNGINAGVLALDKSTGSTVFSALVATYDPESTRISVSLPLHLPIIVFGKVQSHVTASFGSAISTIAGANQTLNFDANTAITFKSNVANVITVVKSNTAASGAINAIAQAGRPLGVFLNITLAAQAAHDSIIRISYNQTQLINAGIQNVSNIKLAFFNEISRTWDFGDWQTIVNTTANYFEARVPHFSTWAPIEAIVGAGVSANSTITPYPGTTLISNVKIDFTNGLDATAKVSLVAGGRYTLATSAGFLVVLTANADCKVFVGASLKFTGLPSGWDQVDLGSFGIGVGFAVGVFVDVQGALSNVALVSPPLPFLGAQLTAGINAGVLALEQSAGTNVFSALVATYDAETQRISVSLPVTLPVIIFGKVQSHVSARFGSSISTIAGANQTLDFDAGTSITFRSNVANVITVIKSNAAASGSINAIAQAGRPLGVFLNISLAAQAAHDSTIRITYNKTDLINAGIQNEANLKLAFFNEATGKWDFGTWVTVVNTAAHYAEANVPHFSTWAPFEQTNSPNSASQASVSIVLIAVLALLALFQ